MKTSAATPKAFIRPASLAHNVKIFHFLIHQLFSHLSADVMNITIIALVQPTMLLLQANTCDYDIYSS